MAKFGMKKYFVAAALGVAACIAWASSPPSAVEAALAANDFLSARSMTQEALREHPESARAHLFNAYILAAADKDKSGAARELSLARSLDLSGKVSGSPLFGRTVAVIEGLASRPAPVPAQTPVATYTPAEPVKEGGGWGWFFVLILLAGGGYAVYRFTRRPVDIPIGADITPKYNSDPGYTKSPIDNSYTRTPYVPSYAPAYRAPVYAPAVQPQQVVVNQGPSVASSMVAGAAAGAVTALAVDSLLHHRNNHDDSYNVHRRQEESYTQPTASVPYNPPAAPAVDYQSRENSFSSGGDSWNDRSTVSSPSSDSWTDSSSSSSSDSSSDW
jgi:hypothetical protein